MINLPTADVSFLTTQFLGAARHQIITPEINDMLLVGARFDDAHPEILEDADQTYLAVLAEKLGNFGINIPHTPTIRVANGYTNKAHDFLTAAPKTDILVFCFVPHMPEKIKTGFNHRSVGQSLLAADPNNWTDAIDKSNPKIIANVRYDYADGIVREVQIQEWADKDRYAAIPAFPFRQYYQENPWYRGSPTKFLVKNMDILVRRDVLAAAPSIYTNTPKFEILAP